MIDSVAGALALARALPDRCNKLAAPESEACQQHDTLADVHVCAFHKMTAALPL
jgi:hypothetical protein